MLTLLFIVFSFVPSDPMPIDCSRPPEPVACCDAEIPACWSCRDAGDSALARWKDACEYRVPVVPVIEKKPTPRPIKAECKKGPPRVVCCQAEIESCLSCKAGALRAMKEWMRKCPPAHEPDYRLLR